MNQPAECRLNRPPTGSFAGRILKIARGGGVKRLVACGLAGWLFAGALPAEPAGVEKPSEEKGNVVERSYVFDAAAHKSLSYALFVPAGYEAAKPAPLIVLLHGWGSTPWQVIHYQGITQEAQKRGYIVAAPYGYNETGGYGNKGPDGKLGWQRRRGAGADSLPENIGELSEKDVFNVLALVRKEYAVDPRRIYLMGHSMGGGGALYLGIKHKGQWAALAALSPAIYTDPEALADIRETPIIMVQGELDRLVPARNTRRWADKMENLKMDHEYIEIKGGDHIWSICANPAMIAKVFDFFDRHPK